MREQLIRPIRAVAEYAAAKAVWEAGRLVRFKVDDPRGHYIIAREALEQGQSLLVYSNHSNQFDPLITARFIDRYLTDLRNVTGIAGLKHYDPARADSKKLTREATALVQKRTGLGMVLVVQEYEMPLYPEPSPSTDNLPATIFNFKAARRVLKKLQEPGQIVFVAPGGTRDKNLPKAVADIDRYLGSGVLAMPLAIVPPERGEIKPFGETVIVRPGMPYSRDELIEEYEELVDGGSPIETLTDLMMVKLARLLPVKNQGDYRDLIPS